MDSLEDLKNWRHRVREQNIHNLVELSKITDLALEKLENHKCSSANHDKAKTLLSRLKELCEEREKTYQVIRKNQVLLEEKYKKGLTGTEQNASELQKQRDQAFELSKQMLALLRSANMQMEENSKKVKRSADIMFHVMYKVEDKYLN